MPQLSLTDAPVLLGLICGGYGSFTGLAGHQCRP